ncbi:O-acetylserine/cysteine exporter [Lampropedia aestuarii]|uniref:O-acetylserine/cysteine exporter n=2 Tax=Lampropedia aestuarii TaxID=2562762 RepID=A0A4S5BQK3_9BURK|nr:EamA family transporter [Lampropedia aestuarii]THJ33453.1 O-acetylserine/cysteine exporter [Lampropedia aestuarii]
MSAAAILHTSMSRSDWLSALAVIVIWGLNFVVMKLGLQTLSPMVLGALRFMAASLPFVLWVRPPKMPWGYVVAYGLAQGLGQFGLLFLGLRLGMTAGMASVVIQTQAFFTLILAVSLLGERAKASQWWGLVLAFGGLIVIATGHGEGALQMTLAGFVLTLGAAFMWAVSNMIVRKASRMAPGYQPLPFIVWSSLVPIVPFWLLAWLQEGGAGIVLQLQAADGKALFAVVYLALLATVLAYSLWTRLLQRHSAARVAPYSLLVPVVGLVTAMLVLGEQPTAGQWLGTAAVIAGMLVNQFGSRLRWHKPASVR